MRVEGRSLGTLPKIIVVLACIMVANAMLYWFIGVPKALDIVETIFGTTHPTLADGSTDVPPFRHIRVVYVQNPVGITLHFVFMPLLLLIGALQFSQRIREQRPRLHRWSGRAFFACLLVGVGGAAIKIFEGDLYGGMLSRLQFTGMAAMTLLCATVGGVAALRRDFVLHERWMWRTYLVVWSSAVVSRLLILLVVPIVWHWMGGSNDDYVIPYNAALAVSWAFPVVVADIFLDSTTASPRPTGRSSRRRT